MRIALNAGGATRLIVWVIAMLVGTGVNPAGAASLVINEVLAENAGGLRDADGDTPDWIEIHNASTNRVNLAGWHLTDTPTNLTGWTFPATNLAPGGFLVVFASLKDRAVPGAELHTNFRLESEGEYLALVEPDGATVASTFSPGFPPQRANVSYGIQSSQIPVLSLDFNDDDSGEAGASNTVAGFNTMTLSSNPSTFGGLAVTISSLGGAVLDDRDRAFPVPSATLTQDQLYDDFIYATGTVNGTGLRVRIAGLKPDQQYYVKLWSVDPGGSTVGERYSDWTETAGGVTNTIAAGYSWNVSRPVLQDGDSTLGGYVRASASGELQIDGTRSGGVSSTVYLNALQLFEIDGSIGTNGVLRFFKTPTPGAPNGPGFLGLVADTRFSVDRGYYSSPFQVAITTATDGVRIYWTTNGSAPSETNGQLYLGPIQVTGTTLLRAAAFKEGWLPGAADTQSYLFLEQVLQQSANQPGYPITWQGSYPADYGIDPFIVGHPVYGPGLSNDLRSLPVLSIVMSHDDMWGDVNGIYNHATSLGPAWERPASAELFQPDGTTEFAVNCGVEIQGGASRDNARTPKHSFRLVFKNEYGPTRLRYDWFPGPVKEFNTIVLRACGFVDAWTTRYSDTSPVPGTSLIGLRYRPENATYLKDVWMKQSLRDMGQPATRSDFVHLFVNGLYWGFYNPSERIDAPFCASHFGGREADWDVMAGDEAYNVVEIRDGNQHDWDETMALVETATVSSASYEAVASRVDLENLADYMLLHIFVESEDWPQHNWYAIHRRATNGLPATPWTFLPWDQEVLLDRYVRRDRSGVDNTNTPARIYARLRAFPEFRRLFGDRVHRHLFNAGVLTAENNIARFEALAARLHRAMVAESARWGDARKFTIGANPGTGVTFTRDEWWVPELQALGGFLPALNPYWIDRFRTLGLYPALLAPQFNQFGGSVPADFELTLTHSNSTGVIYYTLDGSDPRVYLTGALAPGARACDGPTTFNTSTLVRARVLSAGVWSALTEAAFYPPQDLSRLLLNEIMFNPLPAGLTNSDAFEFLELKNAGTMALNLSGLAFTQGISFTFTNGTWLGPGEFAVLVRDPVAFAARYPGVTIHGVYAGKLENTGETLTLSHPAGGKVFSVAYDRRAPWPVTPDGYGFSLVPRYSGQAQAPDKGSNWRASAYPGGSPGTDDPPLAIPPVVINEVLAHTDPPLLDTIELHNTGEAPVEISGWFLTDDPADPAKFRIPDNTILPPAGYACFDASQFNRFPGSPTNFALSSVGDEVYLFAATPDGTLTGYDHGVEFGASFNGASFGHYVNEVGDEFFPLQSSPSLCQSNNGPRIGPVLINEIHYHPGAGDLEFIELLNAGSTSVPLYDVAHPTNAWKLAGASFVLPPNTVLAPQGLLVISATNPAVFRARYAVPESVPVLGPFGGALQDSGERLQLQAPDTPNTNGAVPYVTVEEVRYNDHAPWPAEADGSGLSLQRLNAGFGNSPANWLAAVPTPGRLLSDADTDNDGLPDLWEIDHGTSRFVPDADQDPDGDGLTTWEEYLLGTDPLSAASALRLEFHLESGIASLRFFALSNHAYSVEYKVDLGNPAWLPLTNLSAATSNRTAVVPVLTEGPASFYRLVTPARP
ncbi:MAG TPA: lamin tail domain-containing protein [Verrucomicrobiae bacterium]